MDVVENGWWYTVATTRILSFGTSYLDTLTQAFQAALERTWTCSSLCMEHGWAARRFETTLYRGKIWTLNVRQIGPRPRVAERQGCQSTEVAFAPSWYLLTSRRCRKETAGRGWLWISRELTRCRSMPNTLLGDVVDALVAAAALTCWTQQPATKTIPVGFT